MDKKILKMAVEVMRELSLTEISIKDGDTEISMKRDSAPISQNSASVFPEIEQKTEEKEEIKLTDDRSHKKIYNIAAPLIGVFYRSPDSSSPPFVEIGSRVKKGETLCIIESMKMMNEIPSDFDGTVVDICVDNGSLIEYGHVMFKIEKDT